LLLPAIQREFIWESDRIESLFDSLLQGYPIGSFLFWEVRDQRDKENYRYYEFLRLYRQRYRTHNPEFNTAGHADFEAVLDGQQRLTSIYIGLKETYAYKRPRVWWEDSEYAVPTRRLYLNISGPSANTDEDAGRVYDFRFLTADEFDHERDKWFEVGRMLDLVNAGDLMRMLTNEGYQTNEFAVNALSQLHSIVHTQRTINYYIVQSADMDQALNVFVRVNSGGEPLSLSDILMSTAIANWRTRDAREAIFGLVDQISAKGFFINKDFVLKTCLFLYSADIRYKVTNFTAERVKPFEENWDAIHRSIRCAFDLVKDFGYSEVSLTSKNALLPIIYWIHHGQLVEGIRSQIGFREERDMIRKWLHMVLLKGVFGGSADTILSAIRRAFAGEEFGTLYVNEAMATFPVAEIAAIVRAQGKDPQITKEFIDALLLTEKDEKQAFTILALLRPDLDFRNAFHLDHLHPKASFSRTRLRAACVAAEQMPFYQDGRNWNSIRNLDLLDPNENQSKGDITLEDWVDNEASRRDVSRGTICADLRLPQGEGLLKLDRFPDFIEARHKILGDKLRELLVA
jgi:hypothetical protein